MAEAMYGGAAAPQYNDAFADNNDDGGGRVFAV